MPCLRTGWKSVYHAPRANGCLTPCRVRRLAAAVCRSGLPGRAPRINLGTPISRLAPSLFSPLLLWGRDISCPANMLGYLCTIRRAFVGAVILLTLTQEGSPEWFWVEAWGFSPTKKHHSKNAG